MTTDLPTGPATDGIPDAEVRMTYQMFCDALLAERARILAALPDALFAISGSPHPDDFGWSYRQKMGWSTNGLAAALAAAIEQVLDG